MQFNPTALVLWLVTTSAGYLIGGNLHGAVVGLLVGAGLSLAAAFFPKF